MKKFLIISLLLLIGLTTSVAANSYKPPTAVDKDVGTTKVGNVEHSFQLQAPEVLCEVQVASVLLQESATLPANAELLVPVLTSVPQAHADPPDLLKRSSSINNKNYRRGYATKEIHLFVCCIRQCFSGAVAAA